MIDKDDVDSMFSKGTYLIFEGHSLFTLKKYE